MMTPNAKRILIVDDEAPLRFLLSKQLSLAGFEVETAADGKAALATMDERIDAVVLDVVMPGMDGFEVCRQLKADPRWAGVPIIFLSASFSGDFRRRAFRVGAAEVLAKPFQTEELPTYLRALLSDPNGDRPASEGHIVAVVGSDRAAGSAAAVRLAENEALRGEAPVMLIDLELPAGAIGARLQLAGGPNVRVLLHQTGEPITREEIGRVAQRVHFGLEVIPAPFTPSALGSSEPDTQRLSEMLDLLTAEGYGVVVHLGATPEALAATTLSRAEAVYTVGLVDAPQREARREALVALGAAREAIRPLSEALGSRPARPVEAAPAQPAPWASVRAAVA